MMLKAYLFAALVAVGALGTALVHWQSPAVAAGPESQQIRLTATSTVAEPVETLAAGEDSQALLERSDRLAAVMPEIRAAAEKHSGYAGLYVESNVIVVSTAGDAQQLQQTLDSQFHLDDFAFRVVKVASDAGTLEATKAEVLADIRSLDDSGIKVTMVGIDPKLNVVRIGVLAKTEDIERSLTERYGTLILVEEQQPAEPLACTSRANCPSPMKGGLAIFDWYSTPCTAGFIARDVPYPGAYYLMTAGHCIGMYAGLGNPWFHNGVNFGTASSHFWYSTSDADAGYVLLSATASPGNLLFAASTADIRPMTGWWANASQYVGQYVCKAGATSHFTCGYITYQDYSIYWAPGIWIDHMSQVGLYAAAGDSGSPILSIDKGLGILSGGSAYNIWYSTLEWIRTTTGKEICTTGSC